jgi:hypothetical protein
MGWAAGSPPSASKPRAGSPRASVFRSAHCPLCPAPPHAPPPARPPGLLQGVFGGRQVRAHAVGAVAVSLRRGRGLPHQLRHWAAGSASTQRAPRAGSVAGPPHASPLPPCPLQRLNPFSSAWPRILAARKTVADHNTIGDGTVLGGLLFVRAGDGGIGYVHAGAGLGCGSGLMGLGQGARPASPPPPLPRLPPQVASDQCVPRSRLLPPHLFHIHPRREDLWRVPRGRRGAGRGQEGPQVSAARLLAPRRGLRRRPRRWRRAVSWPGPSHAAPRRCRSGWAQRPNQGCNRGAPAGESNGRIVYILQAGRCTAQAPANRGRPPARGARSDDGRAGGGVRRGVGVVLEVQLGDVVAAHLLPAVLRHVVDWGGGGGGRGGEGAGVGGRRRGCGRVCWEGRAGRGQQLEGPVPDGSPGAAPRPGPGPAAPPPRGPCRAPLTVPPLAQSLKVAW